MLSSHLSQQFPMFVSVPTTPWRQTFTFDLAEIVCMALSLAYLYESIQARRVQSRVKFERNCILHAISGIILKVISNSQFLP
jgi:predicted amidophosphoribosyltransferase